MLFHLCTLFFGDHPDLANRLLDSLLYHAPPNWNDIADIRVGLNCVSAKSRELITRRLGEAPVPVFFYEDGAGQNVYKYPLMRHMLYNMEQPTTAPFLLWFDDDSYLTSKRQSPPWNRFWSELTSLIVKTFDRLDRPAVIGSVYRAGYRFEGEELAAMQQQPWFTGQSTKEKTPFCQGACWTTSIEFLKTWNYPWPELRHNGGDVLLGELIRQQQGKLVHFRTDVAINANALGMESQSQRRGVTTKRPWQPGPAPAYDPNFVCRIRSLRSVPEDLRDRIDVHGT